MKKTIILFVLREINQIYPVWNVLCTGGGVSFIPATPEAVEVALKYDTFDWVLNLSCNYGRSNVLYDTVIESNLEFPVYILNLIASYNIKNFLTIDTGLPQNFNMYSFSKSVFAEFGKYYAEKLGINFINLKLEMFYGADEAADRFLPGCIRTLLKNEPLDVTVGTQKRDIIAVQDVLEVLFTVIKKDIKGYCTIPVGTGVAPTINEIVNYLKEVTGSSSEIHFGAIPMRKNEPDSVADTSKLEKLGCRCSTGWKEGLKAMVEEIKRAPEF